MKKITKVVLLVILMAATACGLDAKGPQKTAGVLGDSYSTFKGWIPEGYSIYYSEKTPEWGNDVCKVEQTWWYQVINELGLKLVINSSYSGSTVGYTGYDGKDYKSFSFVTRTKDITHYKPDVLFICGGTNDSWSNAPIGEIKYENRTEEDLYSFLPAFCEMIETLKTRLPNTRIINVCNSELKEEVMNGEREICEHYGVENLQLGIFDRQGGHPSIEGMASIASQVVSFYNANSGKKKARHRK